MTVSQTDTKPTTFTQGPWRVGAKFALDPNTHGKFVQVYSAGDDTQEVALCCDTDYQDGSAEGNARLIAKAPEMYAALVAAQKYLDEAREAVGSDLDQLADQVADALDPTQNGG